MWIGVWLFWAVLSFTPASSAQDLVSFTRLPLLCAYAPFILPALPWSQVSCWLAQQLPGSPKAPVLPTSTLLQKKLCKL